MQETSTKLDTQHEVNGDDPTITRTKPNEGYKNSFLFNSALGGLAALLMEGTLHPIDTIRTRIKANTKVYVPFIQQIKKMYNREGPLSYFRGLSCTLLGSFIANGSYFYIYEKLKHVLIKKQLLSDNTAPFLAAFVGGFMSDFIYLPFDVIRTRMQLKPGVYDYKNVIDGAKKIVKFEGFRTLYLGAPVFFTLSAVLTSLTFGFYELFHKVLKPIFPHKDEDKANIPLSVSSSILAGSLAAFLTNPLDVLVTRIQSVNTAIEARHTILGLIKTIYKNEGPTGFMKGVSGTMTYYAISAIILFPTYEILRVLFDVDLSDE